MKPVNVLDWRPEDLTGTVDPALVEDTLRHMGAMTDLQRQTLAYALSYWVVEVIQRPFDLEGVLLVDRICALAIRLSSQASLVEFRVRCETLRELLETKRQAIASRLSGRRPLQAGNVGRVLIRKGPLSQTELGQELGLSAGRMNQVLAVMEERGLIQRTRRGGENLVVLS